MKGESREKKAAAVRLLNAGHISAGRSMLEAYCREYPADARARLILGNACGMQGDLQGSETNYRAAVDIDHAFVDAWSCLGKLYEYMRKPEHAMHAYRSLIQLDPGNPDYLCRLANSISLGGDADAALTLFARALDLPSDHEALLPPERKYAALLPGKESNAPVWLATSLAPREYAHQQGAVSSWLAQGFRVISLNAADEIAQLEEHFDAVEFAVAPRDARRSYGRPYVYFDDMLACLESKEGRYGGIINSDIYLKSNGLCSYLTSHARSSCIYTCRVDVRSMEQPDGGIFELGYDFFFFDKEVFVGYPRENFCIGLPWWDYWVTFVPAVRPIHLKRLMTPVAYHVAHSTNWEKGAWRDYAKIMIKHLGVSCEGMEESHLAEHCANYIRAYVAHKSERIFMP